MIEFPDPEESTEEGLVAYGGQWSAEILRAAYLKGIFPWPQDGLPILWFSPDPRGILDFKDFHIPTRFGRELRKKKFQVTRNLAFELVMRGCQKQARKSQQGTWIVDDMIPAYVDLYRSGEAHSWEVWRDQELVGGLYGVFVGGLFSGESMFHVETDASKYALVHMVQDLKSEGQTWVDTQMVTSVTESFGAKYISRAEFLLRRCNLYDKSGIRS